MSGQIAGHIHEIRASLPTGVTLVAVSKFHPIEALREAYDAGQRVFGESRAQELVAKQKEMPEDVEWHFIGPLQTNKVKEIIPYISLIQSVDSERLLQEIEKQAARFQRTVRVLLEIHVACEETKHGFTPAECHKLLDSLQAPLPHVQIVGLMGMATLTDDEEEIRREFRMLHSLFNDLKAGYFKGNETFNTLSMGMSHDYKIALEEGSTMVRIGTHIFGEREY